MNLSPDWIAVFEQQEWEALHWSTVGDPRATDSVIMDWARANGYVVFTHDLDFGTLLATTRVQGPSVIQVRTQDIMPSSVGGQIGTDTTAIRSGARKGCASYCGRSQVESAHSAFRVIRTNTKHTPPDIRHQSLLDYRPWDLSEDSDRRISFVRS